MRQDRQLEFPERHEYADCVTGRWSRRSTMYAITLEIEARWAIGVPREARLCRLCHTEVESMEHYVCRCSMFHEIRGRYHCFFRGGFGPLSREIDYQDQRCLSLFLMEFRRHRESLLQAQTLWPNFNQTQITNFFGHTMRKAHPHDIAPERATQTKDASQGLTIAKAAKIQGTRRPHPSGARPPQPHQARLKEILTQHGRGTSRRVRYDIAEPSSLPAPSSMMDLLHPHVRNGWE
eukprot:c24912_g6_i1 orf=726-1430(+)